MVAHIQGTSRDQIILFPESIDDYIKDDNPVRFIDAFVESLDLKELGFLRSQPKATGRPPYDPADLLKLYVYGYLNRTRSSRRLETEAGRNVEVMWLMRRLAPDFKTIADFRKDNAKALRGVFRGFTLLAKKLELFGKELVAIDGSKFRAQNGKKRNFTKAKLERSLKAIDEKIDAYLTELDENDGEEEAVDNRSSAEELKEKIDSLKKRKVDYEKLKADMDDSGEREISLTDRDARSMMNSQRVEVCYNIQMTVDEKHKLIVDAEATNEPADQRQLTPMATRAKALLGVETLEVLADKGYYDAGEIKAVEDEGITLFIPRPENKGPHKELYRKERFVYDEVKDTYICPAGMSLLPATRTRTHGKRVVWYRTTECARCRLKPRCAKSLTGRMIVRWEHEAVLERMEERVRANQDKVRMRQWIAEHPFGTIKRSFNQGYMLLRGLEKVNAEVSLTALAYNMKRVMGIVGVRKLIAALG